MYRNLLLIAALIMVPLLVFGQRPQHFKKAIPAGNYSGICPIGEERFAVVSDKADTDGFFIFHIQTDTLTGRITHIENEGYRTSGLPNRDMEGICFRPSTQTLFISGETDNEVYEYTLDGQRTGKRLQMPEAAKRVIGNAGLESLTYDHNRHLFFTTTERPLKGDSLLRIWAFGDDLKLKHEYHYQIDAPLNRKFFYGVSELCALDDRRLLVVERQIHVPKLKIGAKTITRIYEVRPGEQQVLKKRLVAAFKTRLNLTSRKFANYEGCCPISSCQLLLIADSQNQYKGMLRDWFKIITIAPAD